MHNLGSLLRLCHPLKKHNLFADLYETQQNIHVRKMIKQKVLNETLVEVRPRSPSLNFSATDSGSAEHCLVATHRNVFAFVLEPRRGRHPLITFNTPNIQGGCLS